MIWKATVTRATSEGIKKHEIGAETLADLTDILDYAGYFDDRANVTEIHIYKAAQ